MITTAVFYQYFQVELEFKLRTSKHLEFYISFSIVIAEQELVYLNFLFCQCNNRSIAP